MPIISGERGGGGVSAPLTLSGSPLPQLHLVGAGVEQGGWDIASDSGAANMSADVHGNDQAAIGLNGTSANVQVANPVSGYYAVLHVLGLLLAVNAAPPDGDISAGEAWLWFDPTNGVGNTKLMVKAKSLDGTVKTAAIALA